MAKVPTKQDWDDGADHYEKHATRFTRLHASDLIATLHQEIQDATTILDIGCGTGAFGLAYLDWFPNGIPNQTIIFSDLSKGMVDKCQQVLQSKIIDSSSSSSSSNFQTKFIFQVEDATELSGIQDGSIDVVVSVFAAFFIPDQTKVMSTIQRVLKAKTKGGGGVLGLTAWTSLPESIAKSVQGEDFGVGFHDTMETVFQHSMKNNNNKGAAKDDDNDDDDKMNEKNEIDAPTWKTWFQPSNIRPMIVDKAGFQSVDIFRTIHTVAWPTVIALWKLFADNPIGPAGKLQPEELEEARQRFFEKTIGSGRVGMDNNTTNNGTDTEKKVEAAPVLLWTASNLVIARGIPTSE